MWELGIVLSLAMGITARAFPGSELEGHESERVIPHPALVIVVHYKLGGSHDISQVLPALPDHTQRRYRRSHGGFRAVFQLLDSSGAILGIVNGRA